MFSRGLTSLRAPIRRAMQQRNFSGHSVTAADVSQMKIASFITLPIIIATSAYVYNLEVAHAAHMKEHPVEKIDYPYLNINVKAFPWKHPECTLIDPECERAARAKEA